MRGGLFLIVFGRKLLVVIGHVIGHCLRRVQGLVWGCPELAGSGNKWGAPG